MNREDIVRMAREAGYNAHIATEHFGSFGYISQDRSDSTMEKFNRLEHFAALVEEHIHAKQLELPEPRLTGKFSITAGKFKCTGCTGTWTDREDAKHHSCKDYQ
jgi:hypothetical protein